MPAVVRHSAIEQTPIALTSFGEALVPGWPWRVARLPSDPTATILHRTRRYAASMGATDDADRPRREVSLMLMANAGSTELDFNEASHLADLGQLADRVVLVVSRARRTGSAAIDDPTLQQAATVLEAAVRDVNAPLRIGARMRVGDAQRLFVPTAATAGSEHADSRHDVVVYLDELSRAVLAVRNGHASALDYERVIDGFGRLASGSLAMLDQHVQRRPRGLPSWT